MSLDKLLDQVKGAIVQHVEGDDSDSNVDTGALLNKVESLFGQHADDTGQSLRSNNQNDDSDDNDDNQDDDDRNDRRSSNRGKSDDDDDSDNNDSDDDDK